MKSRYCLSSDIDRMIELSHDGIHEIIHADHVDENVLRLNLQYFINDPNYFFRVIANDKDIPVAMLIARIAQTWWNEEWVCEGFGIFIDPAYRGKGLSKRLYKEYIDWGKGFDKVKLFRLQTAAGIHLDFSNLYKKLGFDKVGGVFIMRQE